MNNSLRNLLPIVAALSITVVAGCGAGSVPDAAGSQLGGDAREASYNSMAPNIKLTPLEAAVAAAPGLQLGSGRSLVALDWLNQPDAAVQSSLRVKDANGAVVISANRPLAAASLYLRYDGSREHPVQIETVRPDGVSMSIQAGSGLLAIGVSAYGQKGRLDPSRPLATLRFAPGADKALRAASKANNDNRSAVRNLVATDNADSSATLQWSERNTGDYDLNSEVNIADLTPIGVNFFKSYVDETSTDYAKIEIVDGDDNKEVNIADLTPIGANFQTTISGYDVYRTPLSAPDEVPLVTDSGRWTKVPNDAEPAGPSAPREFNGQKARLVYTFHDATGDGDFGWYVVALDNTGTASTKPSNVATVTVTPGGPPPAGLSFEIQGPATEFATVGDEFYLAVKVTDITGLYSANVRFEYDASLVQLLESVETYTDHPNFLEPPLFLAVDDVGSATSPYKLIGFNATQQPQFGLKDGSGALGYFKFKTLAAGINNECFRFPQSTNFIYLWGADYGVSIASPALGSPQVLNIATP